MIIQCDYPLEDIKKKHNNVFAGCRGFRQVQLAPDTSAGLASAGLLKHWSKLLVRFSKWENIYSIQLFILLPEYLCDSSPNVCHRNRSGASAQVASPHQLLFWARAWTWVGASPIQNALCGRAASGKPGPYASQTHTHTGSTSPACAHFPLNSFTLKMLFCSVWRQTQLSQLGLPADTPHRAVAIFQHPRDIQEPAGTTGRFIQMLIHFIHYQPWIRILNEYAFTKTKQKKKTWCCDFLTFLQIAAGRHSVQLVLRDWPLKCTLNCKAKQMIQSESCLNASL